MLVEVLSHLAIGEVSEPLDTMHGFQILQRSDYRSRPEYAVRRIRIGFDLQAGTGAKSEASTLKQAHQIAAKLRRQPALFDELQHAYCCPGVDRYTGGHEPAPLTSILDGLQFGQIAAHEVKVANEWNIVMRVDPKAQPEPPPVVYALPHPQAPDIEQMVRATDGASLAILTRRLGQDARAMLKLSEAKDAALERVHERLAGAYETSKTGDDRVAAMRVSSQEFQQALGPADYGRYEAFVVRWSSDQYLALQR
jgi:hypothetical protein